MSSAHGDTEHESIGHVVPLRVLIAVLGALLILTVVTVGITYVDLGKLNIWIALLIAVLKAALVVMYFMHLRYDKPFHGLILVTSLLFVVLFIGLALRDSHEYQENFLPPSSTSRMGQSA